MLNLMMSLIISAAMALSISLAPTENNANTEDKKVDSIEKRLDDGQPLIG